MRKLMAVMSVACVLSPLALAWSALPPLYQNIREYKALIENPQLGQLMHSGEQITSIERTQMGFIVTGTQTQLEVEIVYSSEQSIGPVKFSLVFNQVGKTE